MTNTRLVTDEIIMAFDLACDVFVLTNDQPCDTHEQCLRFEREKHRAGIAAALALLQVAQK